jgi:hypothetical protein
MIAALLQVSVESNTRAPQQRHRVKLSVWNWMLCRLSLARTRVPLCVLLMHRCSQTLRSV